MSTIRDKFRAAWSAVRRRQHNSPTTTSGQAPARKRNAKHYLRRFATYCGLWALVLVLTYASLRGNFLRLFGDMPSLESLENPEVQQASEIYTADGLLMGKYFTENRSPVSYDQLSKHIVHALIATEDIRFEKHSGIDWKAIPSIVIYKLKGDKRGASTLTQQLAKNLYNTRAASSHGLLGLVPGLGTGISKAKEWITAIELERRFSKSEILTMYLNTVDFGANSFGVKTAARTFFNTSTDSLTLSQSAMLVGLLKAPSYYSPIISPESKKRCVERRNTVLSQMRKYSYIQDADYQSAKSGPVQLDFHVENYSDGPATHFRTVLTTELREILDKLGYDLYTDGLKIYTTIDSKVQKIAEESVRKQMEILQKRFDGQWGKKNPWVDRRGNELTTFIDSAAMRLEIFKQLLVRYEGDSTQVWAALNKPKPMRVFTYNGGKDVVMSSLDSLKHYKRFLHAGFMAMDPTTAQIRAWVGGVDYEYFKYDHVKQSRRQPGSTFKPILYAAAFENGMGPCDTMIDQQKTFKYLEHGVPKTWTPHNADGVFSGRRMTLRAAMAQSINSIAAQLTARIGWDKVALYARKLGLKGDIASVPSIGLGSSDASVWEMVGAYATFMNHGVYQEPTTIVRILDRYGKQIYVMRTKRERALSEETAWLMTYMLRGGLEEPNGTSQALFQWKLYPGWNNDIGGKTGTSSNHSDGWFIGMTKDIVAGMWVGGEDRAIHFRGRIGEGSKTALPIFGYFLETCFNDKTTGITKGVFPKATVEISKPHNCRSAYIPRDTAKNLDSLDVVNLPVPAEEAAEDDAVTDKDAAKGTTPKATFTPAGGTGKEKEPAKPKTGTDPKKPDPKVKAGATPAPAKAPDKKPPSGSTPKK